MRLFFEDALLIHLFDQGTNLVVGELADVVAEENLVFRERGQGRGDGGLEGLGHISPSGGGMADL